MTFLDVIVYLIIMVITVVKLMNAWFLDSELSICLKMAIRLHLTCVLLRI